MPRSLDRVRPLMRPILLLAFAVILLPFVVEPAAAKPPTVDRCVWIINGPTLFNRVCADTSDTDCPAYQESWTWEGGYRKRCYV